MTIGTKIGSAFAVGLVIILAVGTHAYVSTQRLLEANRWVTHTHEVIEDLEHVLSVLTDAETGQRGFVLTGEERYLEPYNAAEKQYHGDIDALTVLTADDPIQQTSLQQVHKLADAKMAELKETIDLRRKSGLDAALPVILTDRGKKIMDDLRSTIAEMKTREQQLLEERNNVANASANRSIWTIVVWMPIALLVLAIAAVVLIRTARFGGSAVQPSNLGGTWIGIAGRYASAVVIVAVAVVLQSQLERVFGKLPVFIVFYPAVLLVASIGGGGPGILATLLSAMTADYWFIPPYGAFTVDRPNDVLALGIFTGANLFVCILAERLRRSRWAEAVNVAQEQQLDELARMNEELSQQSEELSQQTEELSEQSEELAQQNEELQTQSEEIQGLNNELQGREDMLQKLLDSARLATAEAAVIREICAAGLGMFGPAASVVAVYEKQGSRLMVRAAAGFPDDGANLEPRPLEHSFAGLVIAENKTACLPDASLRPDLTVLQIPGQQPFRAVLATPMCIDGEAFGVVAVYSRQKQEWTAVQFRLAEWLAAQCAHILQTLRLQEQMRRQAALIDLSPDAIIVRKLDGTVTFWSRGAETLYGWNKDEAIGQQTHTIFKTQFPEPLEQIVEKLKHSGSWSGDLVHHTEDGRVVVVQSWWMAQLNSQGEVTEILESNVDITERKRAEEALRSVAQFPDENPYPVMRIDRSGIVLYANRSAAALTGPWQCETGRPGSEPLARLVRETLAKGQPSEMDVESGSQVFSFVLAPIAASDYVNLYGRDTTERKRAEEALHKTVDDLVRSNSDLEQFAYVASHDLQEPLRAVNSFVQLLQKQYAGQLDAKADEYILYTVDGAKRMQTLIGDLLSYSRVGSRSQEPTPTEVGVALQHAIGNLEASIQETAAQITHGELPTVLADGGQLVQIFQNLIGNALKFRSDKPPKIHIDARRNETHWEFSVRDNGIGIEPEYRDRIFMIFQRLHTRQQYPGTGIGLAVCKKIVERHGGRIWIESRPGEGSVFYFTLPV